MTKPLFSEVIKICDGVFCNLDNHVARMQLTTRYFYSSSINFDWSDDLIPDNLRQGVVKCRLIYADHLESIDFEMYQKKNIRTVKVVTNDRIDYSFKYADRSALTELLNSAGSDEVLICKNGLITDSSFSNLVFEDRQGGLFTPATFLLNGTKRQALIGAGVIRERLIRKEDIYSFVRVYFINTMLDLEDGVCADLKK